MPYGFYITDRGRELLTQATQDQSTVEITKVCFGSGGNPNTGRDYSRTELTNQFYERNLDGDMDSFGIDEIDPTVLRIATILPNEVGGTVNEMGFKDKSDNLIFYGVVKERTKEAGSSSEGFQLNYENWIKLENVDTEKIEIKTFSLEFTQIQDQIQEINDDIDGLRDTIENLTIGTLKDYAKLIDLDKKVDKVDGKSLVSNEDITQITTNMNSITRLDRNKVDKVTGSSLITESKLAQIDTNKSNISTLQSGKVDKVSGSSLITTTDLNQITTNKNNISNLQSNKVDKVSGKGLISTTDVNQITTNKSNITSLTNRVSAIESQLSGVETLLIDLNKILGEAL